MSDRRNNSWHRKKLWQRLFSGNKAEEKGITVVEEKTIQESLESEYGLTIQADNITFDELSNQHYRRITGNELARVNQIFQFIPQIIANNVNQQAVNAAFKAATEGTYRVRLDAGMHLCRSHLTPGAYRAVGLSNTTNQIACNAELFVNDAVLSVSNAPQIALGVFNVASMVTGQYFMSQINAKLDSLSSSINRVEKLLDAQRHGELKTIAQELSDIIAKVDFIICDTDKTNSEIARIHGIQHIANNAMNTCQELGSNEMYDMHAKDKVDKIKLHIERISQNLVEYRYATHLYGIATLLEVQLRNITDPSELREYREQIDRRIDQFKQDRDNCHEKVNAYLDETRALNNRNFIQWVTSGAAGALSTWFTGAIVGGKAFSVVDGLFSKYQKQKKEKLAEKVEDCFEPLLDTIALESPASTIDLYIETVGQEIKFIKIGEEYYTNLPEA